MHECKYKNALVLDGAVEFFEDNNMLEALGIAVEEGSPSLRIVITDNYKNHNIISVYDFCGALASIFKDAGYATDVSHDYVVKTGTIAVGLEGSQVG